jgi:hypothetical protein
MNSIILSAAFFIGIGGGDGQTLVHLENKIAWYVPAEKQNTLTPARSVYLSVPTTTITLPQGGSSEWQEINEDDYDYEGK